MEQNANSSERCALAGRVLKLMAELEKRKDPRYQEILGVLEDGRKSHPSYDFNNPTRSAEAFSAGHKAVMDYVRGRHLDLYLEVFVDVKSPIN